MASSSWHLSLSDFDKIIVNFCHHGLKAPAIQIIIKCKLGIESELSHQDTVRRQMRAFFYLWQPTLPTRFPISDNNTGRYIALGETSQEHLNRMMLFTEQEIDAIKHVRFDVSCVSSSWINNHNSW